MPERIAEEDWKTWRKLFPIALDRCCQGALDEVSRVVAGAAPAHERYRKLFTILKARDAVIAEIFDDPTRSIALVRIARAIQAGLLYPDEVAMFSAETQKELRWRVTLSP